MVKENLTEDEKRKKLDILEKAFTSAPTSQLHEKMMSKELFNKTDIDQKTRVGIKEITLIVRGHFIASFSRKYGYERFAQMVDDYYNKIKEHRPSLEGKSREEFTNVLGREVE